MSKCVKYECEFSKLIRLDKGESMQTNNGFLIAKIGAWYCPRCSGSYGGGAATKAKKPKPAHKQLGQRLSETRGKVVCFLKQNPLSTSQDIYAATGVGIHAVAKKGMFSNPIYQGKRCWRLKSNYLDEI